MGEVEKAVWSHRNEAQGGAGLLGQHLPWDEIAVMLHFGEENDVSRFQVSAAPSVCDEVDGLGGASSEDDLVGGLSVEKTGDLCARIFVSFGGSSAQFVESSVDVGVVVFVVVNDRLDDGSRLLGGGRVIQVDERVAMDFLMKDGEIGAERRKVVIFGQEGGVRHWPMRKGHPSLAEGGNGGKEDLRGFGVGGVAETPSFGLNRG